MEAGCDNTSCSCKISKQRENYIDGKHACDSCGVTNANSDSKYIESRQHTEGANIKCDSGGVVYTLVHEVS
jgi:hypothetical protein